MTEQPEHTVTIAGVAELVEALEREKKTSRRLRSLLRKAAGPMSYGHWPSDFRAEVERALRYDRGAE